MFVEVAAKCRKVRTFGEGPGPGSHDGSAGGQLHLRVSSSLVSSSS